MSGQQITVDHRFRGPETSGNGGYVCGSLAQHLSGPAVVRLGMPPPLNKAMDLRESDRGIELWQGESMIASAWTGAISVDVPGPPTSAEVAIASERFLELEHPYPTCFVCGPQREVGDGLRIFPGSVKGRNLVAGAWTPHESLDDGSGNVQSPFVWSALDCPGGFAFQPRIGNTVLLGQLAVQQSAPVEIEQLHTVVGWELNREGRKHRTGSAIFDSSGQCIGRAEGIWIEVPVRRPSPA